MASQETINTARDLVQRINVNRSQLNKMNERLNNPVCGKPGQGFKAMEKLRKSTEYIDLVAQTHALAMELRTFLAPTKANTQRREARRLLWDQVLEEVYHGN